MASGAAGEVLAAGEALPPRTTARPRFLLFRTFGRQPSPTSASEARRGGRTHRRPVERFPRRDGAAASPGLALRALRAERHHVVVGVDVSPPLASVRVGLDAALGTDQGRRLVVVHGLRRYPLRLPLPSGSIGHGREHPVRLFVPRPAER
jgi:hypothetical protein